MVHLHVPKCECEHHASTPSSTPATSCKMAGDGDLAFQVRVSQQPSLQANACTPLLVWQDIWRPGHLTINTVSHWRMPLRCPLRDCSVSSLSHLWAVVLGQGACALPQFPCPALESTQEWTASVKWMLNELGLFCRGKSLCFPGLGICLQPHPMFTQVLYIHNGPGHITASLRKALPAAGRAERTSSC